MNEDFLGSDLERELIKSGDVFSDDDPVLAALRKAAREGFDGRLDVGRPRKLMANEEAAADALRRTAGDGPTVVRREAQVQVAVHITPSSREALRRIAEQYGYWHDGHGNISMLLDAIGTGKLVIVIAEPPTT